MTARIATSRFATIFLVCGLLIANCSLLVGCSMGEKTSEESAAILLGDTPAATPAESGSGADEGEEEQTEAADGAANKTGDVRVVIKTDKGDINVVVYATKTPVTAASFLNLIKREYYNGLNFHRVIPDFMIQGGCPDGTGAGNPGYKFQDETLRELKHDRPGILSMANSDRYKQAYSNSGRTNGSQFFITHVPTPHLDGMHTVFGAVISDDDQEVVNSIRRGDKIKSITIKDKEAADTLLKSQAKQVAEWNKVLDRKKK